MPQGYTVAYPTVEMMIPELGPFACTGNFRGGLGDLNGHVMEGMVKRGIQVLPITYGYPVHWQTGQKIDYYDTPAHFLFNLDVYIHYMVKTVPVFGIDRAGALVYLINDPDAGILYPGDRGQKLKQAAFLSRATQALLKKIGIPDIVWVHEWMAGACTIPNLQDDPEFENTKFLATIHTPARGALDLLTKDWFDGMAIDRRHWPEYVQGDLIDPTLGMIRRADMVTAVSEECGEVIRAMFPEQAHKIAGIMNGTSRTFLLSPRIKAYPRANSYQLGEAHKGDKAEFIKMVRQETGRQLNPDEPLIGAFRRLDNYKNQLPMFQEHIAAICANRGEQAYGHRGLGANVVIGGVAHESNEVCQGWMREFKAWMDDPRLKGRFVYVDKYSEKLRTAAVRGSDIWVSCPWKRMEACGTSDFGAKINGNLNVATKGGGIKEHGTEFNPETCEGDTLFIEPYDTATFFNKLGLACGWFYQFRDLGDGPWPKLRMNNYQGGEALDVTHMIDKYQKKCFARLMEEEETAQVHDRPSLVVAA